MLTAKQAREMADEREMASPEITRLLDYILLEAQTYGNVSCNYFTGGQHFSEHQLKIIRDLGYHIEWNSPCLWYEVSWE